MYGNNYYKIYYIWGAHPPRAKITMLTFLRGKTLEMDKKLGIILKKIKALLGIWLFLSAFSRNFSEA